MDFQKPGCVTCQGKEPVRFAFASTMENIDSACEKINQYLRSKIEGIDPQLFAINLVLREGLTNAVRHGNAGDPKKVVTCSVSITGNGVMKVEIEDEGDGFDWEKQQDKIPGEHDDHGRGLLIIKTYFTRFSYNQKGNILYLEKMIDTCSNG